MSLRAQIKALHACRCADIEIAEYLGCTHWYVRQCIGRPASGMRHRRNSKLLSWTQAREGGHDSD